MGLIIFKFYMSLIYLRYFPFNNVEIRGLYYFVAGLLQQHAIFVFFGCQGDFHEI